MNRRARFAPRAARGISNTRALTATILLVIVVAVLQWLLWLGRSEETADTFSGPPRSDYIAIDYTLTARDAGGDFNFRVTGPRAVRHPFLGSFDLDEPRMNFRDQDGHLWKGRARTGWINKEGTEVRLSGNVVLDREPAQGVDPVTIESEHLVAHTRENLLESPDLVTVTEPGAKLRGVGMTAKLKERHIVLAADVVAHYDKKLRTPK